MNAVTRNPTVNATRIGLRRGSTEFGIMLRTPEDVTYSLIGIAIVVVVLVLNRDVTLGDSDIPMAPYILGSVVAIQLAFIAAYSVATTIVTEREDGTVLRMKSLPFGLRAYSVGVITRALLELVLTLGISFVIAAIILGGDLRLTPLGTLALVGVIVLGLVALTPLGFVIGSIFRSPRAVGGWGLLVVGGLVWVSGLIQPLTSLPGWAQVVGQASPLYWIGLGVRGTILPEELAVIEIGGTFRPELVFVVLTAWAVVGLVLAPMLLSRAARRETSSAMERRRERALQRV